MTPTGPKDDLEVYAQQTSWLLEQFAENLRALPEELLTARPPAALEGNHALGIARHAAAVTRAYALGIGCGRDVSRDRPTEFSADPTDRQAVLAELDALAREVPGAFSTVDRAGLDVSLVPPQSLYGLGEPRPMTPREAIVENIRHLGIHLGELRLTRSLLEGRAARAD